MSVEMECEPTRYLVPSRRRASSSATTLEDFGWPVQGEMVDTVVPLIAVDLGPRGSARSLRVVVYGTENPFEQLRDSKAEAVKEVVFDEMGRGHVNLSVGSRLIELIDMAVEEYPETEIPGLQMLNSVLGFFRSHRDTMPPSLTLTPAGHVWAQWISDHGRLVALEFRRDGSVNLAAFYPDADEPMRQASIAGNMSWRGAAREFASNHNLSWLLVD